MNWKSSSLRTKLFIAAVIPCFSALVVLRSYVFWRQTQSRLNDFKDHCQTQVRMTAQNTSAALAFQDPLSATNMLNALRENKEFEAAVIFDDQNQVFAHSTPFEMDLPLKSPGTYRESGFLTVFCAVQQRDKLLGHLGVRFSLRNLQAEKIENLKVSFFALGFSLVLAIAITMLMNRNITTPLYKLIQKAGIVMDSHDYSIRFSTGNTREINQLIAAINSMLEGIQKRDAELKYTKDRFEFAVKGTSDGLWEWDAEGENAWFSSRFKEMLGFRPEQFPNSFAHFLRHLHPNDLEKTKQAIREHLEENRPFDVAFRLRTAENAYLWFRSRGDSSRNDKGHVIKMAGSIQDITQQKISEHEQARLLRTIQEKNQELEQIVYVTSHDLRSPLVNIQGFSQELKYCCEDLRKNAAINTNESCREILQTDIPEILNFIISSASTMDRLLSGLLKISRLGRAALNFEPLDINQIVQEVIDSNEWKISHLEGQVQVQTDLPSCFGDLDQTSQVFGNLLGNAIKYRHPQRRLEIEIGGETKENEAIYWVRDNGVGIPEAHQKKVFEVFHRLNPEETEGEGLGLTIVKKSLERQNGRIWLESEKDNGTCFYFALPLQPFNILETRS